MASQLQKMTIFITLIVSVAIPISATHRRRSYSDDTEQYLKDLCSETDIPDVCWKVVKSELRRFHDGSDERDIAGSVIELAMARSKEIRDQLKQWYKDSNDDRLKSKYDSCSSNYNDVDRDLQQILRNLDSDNYLKISELMKDVDHEMEECRRVFGPASVDPGHVGDRNNELGIYLDLVRAATDHYGDNYQRQ